METSQKASKSWKQTDADVKWACWLMDMMADELDGWLEQ